MKPLVWISAAGLALLLVQCSGGGDSNTGTMSIVLKSTSLATRSRTGTACNPTVNGAPEGGLCYTPLSVLGYFNQASLSSTGGGAGVRILGGGSTVGLEGVFKKTAFDLKTPPTIPSSDDNIQDGTAASYDILSISLQAIEVVFEAESTPKYYHMRIPLVNTPPSTSSVFSGCLTSQENSSADEYGTLYGSTNALAGDILICIKTSATDTCADTDYQWVTGGALSATRPGSPERLTGAQLITADSCTPGAEHPEVTWGYGTIDILLDSPVSVTATNGGGGKTYTSGGVSGSRLTVTLDIDTNLSLFESVNGLVTDLSLATQNQILTNIAKIQLKPIYIRNNASSAVTSGDMEASATLTVSD